MRLKPKLRWLACLLVGPTLVTPPSVAHAASAEGEAALPADQSRPVLPSQEPSKSSAEGAAPLTVGKAPEKSSATSPTPAIAPAVAPRSPNNEGEAAKPARPTVLAGSDSAKIGKPENKGANSENSSENRPAVPVVRVPAAGSAQSPPLRSQPEPSHGSENQLPAETSWQRSRRALFSEGATPGETPQEKTESNRRYADYLEIAAGRPPSDPARLAKYQEDYGKTNYRAALGIDAHASRLPLLGEAFENLGRFLKGQKPASTEKCQKGLPDGTCLLGEIRELVEGSASAKQLNSMEQLWHPKNVGGETFPETLKPFYQTLSEVSDKLKATQEKYNAATTYKARLEAIAGDADLRQSLEVLDRSYKELHKKGGAISKEALRRENSPFLARIQYRLALRLKQVDHLLKDFPEDLARVQQEVCTRDNTCPTPPVVTGTRPSNLLPLDSNEVGADNRDEGRPPVVHELFKVMEEGEGSVMPASSLRVPQQRENQAVPAEDQPRQSASLYPPTVVATSTATTATTTSLQGASSGPSSHGHASRAAEPLAKPPERPGRVAASSTPLSPNLPSAQQPAARVATPSKPLSPNLPSTQQPVRVAAPITLTLPSRASAQPGWLEIAQQNPRGEVLEEQRITVAKPLSSRVIALRLRQAPQVGNRLHIRWYENDRTAPVIEEIQERWLPQGTPGKKQQPVWRALAPVAAAKQGASGGSLPNTANPYPSAIALSLSATLCAGLGVAFLQRRRRLQARKTEGTG